MSFVTYFFIVLSYSFQYPRAIVAANAPNEFYVSEPNCIVWLKLRGLLSRNGTAALLAGSAGLQFSLSTIPHHHFSSETSWIS